MSDECLTVNWIDYNLNGNLAVTLSNEERNAILARWVNFMNYNVDIITFDARCIKIIEISQLTPEYNEFVTWAMIIDIIPASHLPDCSPEIRHLYIFARYRAVRDEWRASLIWNISTLVRPAQLFREGGQKHYL